MLQVLQEKQDLKVNKAQKDHRVLRAIKVILDQKGHKDQLAHKVQKVIQVKYHQMSLLRLMYQSN